MSRKACEKELKGKNMIYGMFTKEVNQIPDIPPEVQPFLKQYADVFPDDFLRVYHLLEELSTK